MSRSAAEVLTLPLGEIGRLLRAGETTPTALADAALAALDGTGRSLNAVAALLPARAWPKPSGPRPNSGPASTGASPRHPLWR
jgi:Asp-tRNA(Asn)/Glu-tRNA(Gln) amidotransferase A subunit family amidase